MCRLIEITRDAVPRNISIEFQRDAAVRACEIVIINRDRNGQEQGIKIYCFDNGNIGVPDDVPIFVRK